MFLCKGIPSLSRTDIDIEAWRVELPEEYHSSSTSSRRVGHLEQTNTNRPNVSFFCSPKSGARVADLAAFRCLCLLILDDRPDKGKSECEGGGREVLVKKQDWPS